MVWIFSCCLLWTYIETYQSCKKNKLVRFVIRHVKSFFTINKNIVKFQTNHMKWIQGNSTRRANYYLKGEVYDERLGSGNGVSCLCRAGGVRLCWTLEHEFLCFHNPNFRFKRQMHRRLNRNTVTAPFRLWPIRRWTPIVTTNSDFWNVGILAATLLTTVLP